MARRRRQKSDEGLIGLIMVGFIIGLFVMFYKMLVATKGPWRWIFIGLLILAVVSYSNEWAYGTEPFFIAAPILCWISDYVSNGESKMSIPFIIAGSVIWVTIFFAFLY